MGVLAVFAFSIAFAANENVATVPNESYTLPQIKYMPDSPFYGVERFVERMNLWFTFNDEAKIKLHLKYAERRLAEAKAMAEKNNVNYSEKILKEYENELNKTINLAKYKYDNCVAMHVQKCDQMNLEERCSELNLSTSSCGNLSNVCQTYAEKKCSRWANLTEKVSNATMKHIYVLNGILEKVPIQAKEAIRHAIDVSQMNKKNILEKIESMHQVREELRNASHGIGPHNWAAHENWTAGQNVTQGENKTSPYTGHLPPHEKPQGIEQ